MKTLLIGFALAVLATPLFAADAPKDVTDFAVGFGRKSIRDRYQPARPQG